MKKLNEQEFKIPTIKHVGILYSISMVLFIGIGGFIEILKLPTPNYKNQMMLIVLIQVLFVFLPTLIYLVINKINIKRTFRLNKVSFFNIIISIFIMLFAIPIASTLNAVILLVLNYFGKMHQPVTFPTENIYQLIINILVVALTPAIFEELLFRGVVLKAYEEIGRYKAIILSSLLFALLHRDIQSLVGTFVLGLVIAYIVYRTNSIFAGMIAHFTNNAFIVFMTYISTKYQSTVNKTNPNIMEEISKMDVSLMLSIIVILIIILLAIMAIFIGLVFLLRYTTRNIKYDDVSEIKSSENYLNMPLVTSIILVIFIFIKQMI